jgi:hypothetical protein
MKWYVLTGIIMAGTTAIAGMGYYAFRPKSGKDTKDSDDGFADQPKDLIREGFPAATTTTTTTNNHPPSGFPLKKGSSGTFVTNLQNALITYFPLLNPLPKYGADGSWGSEVQKFLEDNSLETVIDKTTYTDYITGNFPGLKAKNDAANTAPKTTASSNNIIKDIIKSVIPSYLTDPNVRVGWQLFDTVKAKNLAATISLLQQLKNTTHYQSASSGFQYRPYQLPFRKFTLVSGLFDSFTSQSDKNTIRTQLRKMGLKETIVNSEPANYDSTWSLSGLGIAHRNIRTKMKALISDGFNIRIEIPTRTLLGQWLASGNGYTRFRTQDGRDMYVRTNAVMFD